MIKCVFFDFSGTITTDDGLGVGPYMLGRKAQFKELERQYFAFEIDPKTFIIKAMTLWKDLTSEQCEKLAYKIHFLPGVKEFIADLKKRCIKSILVVKGPDILHQHTKKILGFDYIFTTKCEIKNGKLTGKIIEFPKPKDQVVEKFMTLNNLKPEDCAAIGDDISDLKMLQLVGTKITYKGIKEIQEIADIIIDDYTDLSSRLFS